MTDQELHKRWLELAAENAKRAAYFRRTYTHLIAMGYLIMIVGVIAITTGTAALSLSYWPPLRYSGPLLAMVFLFFMARSQERLKARRLVVCDFFMSCRQHALDQAAKMEKW